MGLFDMKFALQMLLPQVAGMLKSHPEILVDVQQQEGLHIFTVAVPEAMMPPEALAKVKELLNGR